MNRYRKVVILLRILSAFIMVGTIGVIAVPVVLFFGREEQTTSITFLMDESPYEWLIGHEKVCQIVPNEEMDMFDPNQIVFADEQLLEEVELAKIKQNSIVMERVFHEVNENEEKIKKLSSMTGITFTGFEGKTYEDLSSKNEIPEKLIQNYESNSGMKWNFEGEGIVMTNGEKVIVLEEGKDYKGSMTLKTDALEIPFRGNFEVTSGSINTTSIADFQIDLSKSGKEQLDSYGLNAVFSACYEMTSPLYNLVYFTGDFSSYRPGLPVQYEWFPSVMKHKLLYTAKSNEQVYWQWYYPELVTILNEDRAGGSSVTESEKTEVSKNLFVTENKKIYQLDTTGNKKEFFIKGVNLGAAMPGKEFTEFPLSKEVYLNWFSMMKELNVNTVRIYTLFPPVFYEALYEFNMQNEEPIYLLQEIWPEENPIDSNYLGEENNQNYHEEINRVVDAIHGNANIPERKYRAYGLYRFDVSNYLVSFLVGREMEPEEVLETDRLNSGYQYTGNYLFSEEDATPTEGWLAESCDYVLQREEQYQSRPIVGVVSWPTLDPMEHDSEWNEEGDKTKQYNDMASVDINHIGVITDNVSGFVGAYHIYPNYPDFMNNESQYADYQDEEGTFRYGGYLQDFMEHNTKYPAIVAEYGISTSMYTAHYNPDGYDHGGLSEEEQADGIIRMTKAIRKEGYSGAVIFEWMDEWAKKTWITEPYMIPFARNPFWHNAMDPEQNYGLLSYSNVLDPLTNSVLVDTQKEDDVIDTIKVSQDEAFLYVDIGLKEKSFVKEAFTMKISIDSEITGMDYDEFLVRYDATPEILVNPGYNWTKGHYMATYANFDDYEEMIQVTNPESIGRDGTVVPELTQNLSKLSVGSFTDTKNQVQIEDNHVIFRFPYGLLGISDPSTMQIFADSLEIIPEERDQIQVKMNPVIKYQLEFKDQVIAFEHILIPWEIPEATSRKKDGFDRISAFFGDLE